MIKNAAFMKMLIDKEIISEYDAETLLDKYNDDAYAVLVYLLHEGIAKKNDLGRMWGDSINVAYVDLDRSLIQSEIVSLLPEEFARENRIIPLYRFGDTITTASTEPLNLFILEEAQELIGSPISAVFGIAEDIMDAVDIHYRRVDALFEYAESISENSVFQKVCFSKDEKQLKMLAFEKPVEDFALTMLLLGVKERATDMHIEHLEDFIRVRFRIDGVLHEKFTFEKPFFVPLAARLKYLAQVDLSVDKIPKEGRFSINLTNKSLNFSLSSIPTLYGEKIVVNMLSQIQVYEVPELTELSFSHSTLENVRRASEMGRGMFLVTGPPGSGKTTTLYSMLKVINSPEKNIMTVEDHIKYKISGINQSKADPIGGFGYVPALQSFLRQDPDVILVGEIRDRETAVIAMEASVQNRMVLTSMMERNALSAVGKLIDLGVSPLLLAHALTAVMAQYMLKRVCGVCRTGYEPDPSDLEKYFTNVKGHKVSFYSGKGCSECSGSGYFGRLPIQEILLLNDEIRATIALNAEAGELAATAAKYEFKPMRYDGLKKVLRGLTSIRELEQAPPAY